MLRCNVTQDLKYDQIKSLYSNPKEDDNELKFTRAGTEEETPEPLGISGSHAAQSRKR